ncbi:hypothetical protein LCGC14_1511390 [marine sediment metagenome]|uniref:Uncharacterized protein n=1 Tax=marine sediment metagenome TaxID=412755 RepID=A0A0F9J1D1_9ZZZZ
MAPVAVLIIGALLIYAGVTGRIEGIIRALNPPDE